MTNPILLIFLSILPIYLITIINVIKRIPNSISETYYILGEIYDPLKWLFTITLFGISAIPIMLWVDYNYPPMVLLSSMGLTFVGIMNEFKTGEKLERWIHYGGALLGIGCILVSQMIMGIILPIYIFLFLSFLLIVWGMTKEREETLFWVEVIGYLCSVGGVLVS